MASMPPQAAAALVALRVSTDVDVPRLGAAMTAMPAVTEVLDLSGPWDHQVRVRSSGQGGLYDVVSMLRVLPGIIGMETRTVLREVLAR